MSKSPFLPASLAILIAALAAPTFLPAQQNGDPVSRQSSDSPRTRSDRSDHRQRSSSARDGDKYDSGRRRQDSSQDSESRSGGSRKRSERLSGEGTIERTKKVAIPGTTVENLVVLIKSRKPDSQKSTLRIADLGPVRDLKALKLGKGDKIRITGRVVRVKDKDIMMVETITVDDQTQTVQRQEPESNRSNRARSSERDRDSERDRRSSSERQRDNRNRTSQNRGDEADGRAGGSVERSEQLIGEGTIRRTKKVAIPGTTIENLVVLLDVKAPDSRSSKKRIADLGPVRDLKSLKLREGDQVQVTGRVVRVGDKEILMADEVTAHGSSQKIKRQKPRDSDQRSPNRSRQSRDHSHDDRSHDDRSHDDRN